LAAIESYRDEQPISSWKKTDIIKCIELLSKGNPVSLSIDKVKKMKLDDLKLLFLEKSTFGKFTSQYHNYTALYHINYNLITSLKDEEIEPILEQKKEKKAEIERPRKGNIAYTVWHDRGDYKAPETIVLMDVNMTLKGSYIIVTDDDGKELVRKKIHGSGVEILYTPEYLNFARGIDSNLRFLYRKYWHSFSAIKRFAEEQTVNNRHDIEIEHLGEKTNNPWRDRYGRSLTDNEAIRYNGCNVLFPFCEAVAKILENNSTKQ
jgi:hypothetical protein